MRFCRVLLRESVRQTDKAYTYKVPESLADKVVPGSYVKVPFGFGNRTSTALVVSVSDNEADLGFDPSKLKEVNSLLDLYPVLKKDQLALLDPLKKRLLCTYGDVITMMIPAAVGTVAKAKATFVELSSEQDARAVLASGGLRSVAHIHMLEYLLDQGTTERKKLLSSVKASDAQLRGLKEKGLIKLTIRMLTREEIEEESIAVDEGSPDAFRIVHELNDEQQEAYETVRAALGSPQVFLLNGITGSGKTEVYLKCAGEVLDRGGCVIYLVPEISLTPQTVSWIRGRFGDTAAVMHSRLTDRQRYDEWDRIRRGQARIVVGPRSSIFAPVENLKLIIIDEEHDSSYKSESFPKYSTRDIAFLRMKYNSCPLILGSATPLVTSYYAAANGQYRLLKLNKRASADAVLPEVSIVDMRRQVQEGYGDLLSAPLRVAMAKAFSEGQQVMLFLNRRGYSRTLICSSCGEPVYCPDCSVAMTLHYRKDSESLMICHYCGYTIPCSKAVCKECEGTKFKRAGVGTQKLEEILKELYPDRKVLRMDQDTTMLPGAHETILGKFRNKEADILIGTQMIAKGHDFPSVTVVGVLGADLISMSSDYKSSERAFELITQAAGRAGRGNVPGKVFLQSLHPDNPLLMYAADQDYEAFYDSEIKYRQVMSLPPFKAVGEIILSLPDEDMLIRRSEDVRKYLKDFLSYQDSSLGLELFGPVPAPIYELRGRYRYVFMIKSTRRSYLNEVFRQMMEDFDPSVYPLSFDNDAGGS
ncbi:MAG: primosomal protein N' [Clostridiales bacterium]|nr:primosomal protein N' [Clostridiales bacterium]